MAVTKGKPAEQQVADKPEPPVKPAVKPPVGALRKTSLELRTVERVINYDSDLLNSLRMSVDDKIMERGVTLNETQQAVYDMLFIEF